MVDKSISKRILYNLFNALEHEMIRDKLPKKVRERID